MEVYDHAGEEARSAEPKPAEVEVQEDEQVIAVLEKVDRNVDEEEMNDEEDESVLMTRMIYFIFAIGCVQVLRWMWKGRRLVERVRRWMQRPTKKQEMQKESQKDFEERLRRCSSEEASKAMRAGREAWRTRVR